jgi:hypothetical protein
MLLQVVPYDKVLHKPGTVSWEGACAQGGTDTCVDTRGVPTRATWSIGNGPWIASCDKHVLIFMRNYTRNEQRRAQRARQSARHLHVAGAS